MDLNKYTAHPNPPKTLMYHRDAQNSFSYKSHHIPPFANLTSNHADLRENPNGEDHNPRG